MRAYRQTFRRHRWLLIAPIILAAMIGGMVTFRQPPTYTSYAALWVDNGPAVSSSVSMASSASGLQASVSDPSLTSSDNQTDPSAPSASPPGPAGMEAAVVSQLLLISSFDEAVAQKAKGAESLGITAWATGPQVLWLKSAGPSPYAALSVLRALVQQLGVTGSAFGESIGRTASTLYGRQLGSANSLVTSNQTSLATYARNHPHANAGNDATYRALVSEVQAAEGRRAMAEAASTQADTEAKSNGGGGTMRVLDPPSLPLRPSAALASKLAGVVTGAFAGLVVSLLALIALTPRPPVRWDAEVPLFARLAAWDQPTRRGRGRSVR